MTEASTWEYPAVTPSDTPPSGDDPGVLSGLSRTRPQRRSNKRPGPAPAADGPAPDNANAAGSAKATAPKPRKADSRTTTTAAKKKSSAAKKGSSSAKKGASAAKKGSTAAKRTAVTTPEPPAVEVGRVADQVTERPAVAATEHTGGTDLVGQAIQAAGEVAQLGVGLGRQVAKGILSRLPKP